MIQYGPKMNNRLLYPSGLRKAPLLTINKRFLVIILAGALFATFSSPQIAFFGRGLRLSLPLFVLLFATTDKTKILTRHLKSQTGPLLCGVAFIGISLLRYFFDPNPDLLHNYVVSGSTCIVLWICILIIKYIFSDTLEHVRWISLIVLGISLGLGIPLLIREPGIAKLTMEADTNIASAAISLVFPQGVANYSWYTAAAFAWPVMASWLYKCRQTRIRKLLGWGALFAVSIAILLSTFTAAILLLLLGIVGWLFFVFINNKNPRLRVVVIIIVVIFGVSFSSLYLFGSKYKPTSSAVEKATQFLSGLWQTHSLLKADPTIRTALFIETMKTFVKNPIFGAWGLSTDNFAGGHSSWADTLALQGLFGILLWFGFLSPSLRRGKHQFSVSEGNAGGTLSWILLLAGGILNPTFFGELGLLLLWLFDLKDIGNS